MFYKEPLVRIAGDRYLLIEFGNDLSLDLNFTCIALGQRIQDSKKKGVIETLPSYTTLLVHYEPKEIASESLIIFCKECLRDLPSLDCLQIPSRRIQVPITYNDRWSKECVKEYCRTIKPVENNAEFVARINGLKDVDELSRFHSAPEWWVGHIGFIAGLPSLMSLDPRYQLRAPRYDPPRLWTPRGTVALGGAFTAIYSTVTPDGYQILGRTPLVTYDPQRQLPAFENSYFLFRIGDRIKFIPIDEEEFVEIEQAIEARKYNYQIQDGEVFSVRQYKEFCKQLAHASDT